MKTKITHILFGILLWGMLTLGVQANDLPFVPFEPTPPAETESPETESPETESPETEAPETESPETEVPETESPETEAPETSASSCLRDFSCPLFRFSDLDRTAWYHDGIHFCIERELMNGVDTALFSPDTTTSRAMIVTVLWRLAGKPMVVGRIHFDDVKEDQWYSEAVKWAAANSIVNGYGDGRFGPDDPITREQLAAILYRYELHKGGGIGGTWTFSTAYSDFEEVSDWAVEAMYWMTANGVINGKPGNLLDPKGSATRAEAATMLYRYVVRKQ